ncbi:FAD-binding protein [Halostella salina]|uniref:FAD-binding protein n=1 Tax=Halostella salina TaxID=1547897 RepID=UPI000EF7C063|nr:FAD-binding protein [Halostella salina]
MAATYDIVVVGGGTAGCFAAATAADRGVGHAPLERNVGEADHVAFGDGSTGNRTSPDAGDRANLNEASFQSPCHA